jgi:hypothetical protein
MVLGKPTGKEECQEKVNTNPQQAVAELAKQPANKVSIFNTRRPVSKSGWPLSMSATSARKLSLARLTTVALNIISGSERPDGQTGHLVVDVFHRGGGRVDRLLDDGRRDFHFPASLSCEVCRFPTREGNLLPWTLPLDEDGNDGDLAVSCLHY